MKMAKKKTQQISHCRNIFEQLRLLLPHERETPSLQPQSRNFSCIWNELFDGNLSCAVKGASVNSSGCVCASDSNIQQWWRRKKISAMCKLSKAKSWMFEEQREWQRRSFNIQFLITFFSHFTYIFSLLFVFRFVNTFSLPLCTVYHSIPHWHPQWPPPPSYFCH